MLQNECTRRKVKCLTRRIDGWLGVAIISARQGKLTLKNILQSQAEKTFDLVVGFKTAGKDILDNEILFSHHLAWSSTMYWVTLKAPFG